MAGHKRGARDAVEASGRRNDSDDSEEEIEIELDGSLIELDCGFLARAWDGMIDDARMRTLEEEARMLPSDTTFWTTPDREPSSALEAYALDVWRFHMGAGACPQLCDPQRSGVEFWVQRRSSRQARAARAINWHFDKDERLREDHGVFVHPYLSTVTYTSDLNGAPTVVLPVRISFDGQQPTPAPSGVPTTGRGVVSFPKRGRHLAFNGRLLHGCPVELAHEPRGAYERMTILVNVWVNHRPRDVEVAQPRDQGHGGGSRGPVGAKRARAHAAEANHVEQWRALTLEGAARVPMHSLAATSRADSRAFACPVGDVAEATVALPARSLKRVVRSAVRAVTGTSRASPGRHAARQPQAKDTPELSSLAAEIECEVCMLESPPCANDDDDDDGDTVDDGDPRSSDL